MGTKRSGTAIAIGIVVVGMLTTGCGTPKLTRELAAQVLQAGLFQREFRGRRLDAVTGIAMAPDGRNAAVEFKATLPRPGKEYDEKSIDYRAQFRLFDDGWRIEGEPQSAAVATEASPDAKFAAMEAILAADKAAGAGSDSTTSPRSDVSRPDPWAGQNATGRRPDDSGRAERDQSEALRARIAASESAYKRVTDSLAREFAALEEQHHGKSTFASGTETAVGAISESEYRRRFAALQSKEDNARRAQQAEIDRINAEADPRKAERAR
jgi:hypothetical protein